MASPETEFKKPSSSIDTGSVILLDSPRESDGLVSSRTDLSLSDNALLQSYGSIFDVLVKEIDNLLLAWKGTTVAAGQSKLEKLILERATLQGYAITDDRADLTQITVKGVSDLLTSLIALRDQMVTDGGTQRWEVHIPMVSSADDTVRVRTTPTALNMSRFTGTGLRVEERTPTQIKSDLSLHSYSDSPVAGANPTDAEIDTAFGTPATVGSGFTGVLDDSGGGTAVFLCSSDGTNWWYQSLTKAI